MDNTYPAHDLAPELDDLSVAYARLQKQLEETRARLSLLCEAAESVRAEYATTIEIENVSGKTFARRMRWSIGHLAVTRELVMRESTDHG
jgi:hypothetical protein